MSFLDRLLGREKKEDMPAEPPARSEEMQPEPGGMSEPSPMEPGTEGSPGERDQP